MNRISEVFQHSAIFGCSCFWLIEFLEFLLNQRVYRICRNYFDKWMSIVFWDARFHWIWGHRVTTTICDQVVTRLTGQMAVERLLMIVRESMSVKTKSTGSEVILKCTVGCSLEDVSFPTLFYFEHLRKETGLTNKKALFPWNTCLLVFVKAIFEEIKLRVFILVIRTDICKWWIVHKLRSWAFM